MFTQKPEMIKAADEMAKYAEGQLTSREQEILSWLSHGLSYKEIAWNLKISLHTVRNHTRNAIEKLGAKSKVEAVVTYVRIYNP
jgi:DNA-binding CsgD family transcriptional regulator